MEYRSSAPSQIRHPLESCPRTPLRQVEHPNLNHQIPAQYSNDSQLEQMITIATTYDINREVGSVSLADEH